MREGQLCLAVSWINPSRRFHLCSVPCFATRFGPKAFAGLCRNPQGAPAAFQSALGLSPCTTLVWGFIELLSSAGPPKGVLGYPTRSLGTLEPLREVVQGPQEGFGVPQGLSVLGNLDNTHMPPLAADSSPYTAPSRTGCLNGEGVSVGHPWVLRGPAAPLGARKSSECQHPPPQGLGWVQRVLPNSLGPPHHPAINRSIHVSTRAHGCCWMGLLTQHIARLLGGGPRHLGSPGDAVGALGVPWGSQGCYGCPRIVMGGLRATMDV